MKHSLNVSVAAGMVLWELVENGNKVSNNIISHMPSFKNYLSLVKFSHTLFALPFALIGFFLGLFGWKNLMK